MRTTIHVEVYIKLEINTAYKGINVETTSFTLELSLPVHLRMLITASLTNLERKAHDCG